MTIDEKIKDIENNLQDVVKKARRTEFLEEIISKILQICKSEQNLPCGNVQMCEVEKNCKNCTDDIADYGASCMEYNLVKIKKLCEGANG